MIYLYGLAGDAEALELGTGASGEPLRALACGELVAIVGEPPLAPPVNAATLAAHDQAVRRAAARVPAFLPARFGQVFPTAPELARAIAVEAEGLSRALDLVRGCAQMTLRLFQQVSGAGEQPAAIAPATGGPEPDAPAAGPGTRFLGARRAAAAAAASLPELEPARRALAPFIRAERVRRSTATGFVGTAYHLVATADVAGYLAVARSLPANSGQRVAVSGPWPAYAFAPEVLS